MAVLVVLLSDPESPVSGNTGWFLNREYLKVHDTWFIACYIEACVRLLLHMHATVPRLITRNDRSEVYVQLY